MNKHLVFITVIGCLGGLLIGFDIAVVNGTMPLMNNYFGLTLAMTLGLTVSSTMFGCFIGAFFIGNFSERSDGRDLMKILSLIYIISSIGSGISDNYVFFFIFRVITGMVIGGLTVICPVYLSEVAPPALRGRVVAFFPLAIFVGILLGIISNSLLIESGANNWRWMFIASMVPAIIFIGLLFNTVRTPRWLTRKGYDRETSFVTRLINPDEEIDLLMKEIKSAFSFDKKKPSASIFNKPYQKILLVAILLCIFNQFAGFSLILYYLSDLFSMAGYPSDYNLELMVYLGLISLVPAISGIVFIDKIGRKKLLQYGAVLTGIMLMALAILLVTGTHMQIIFTSVVIILIGFYSATFGVAMWCIIPEMFPNDIRSRSVSLVMGIYWLINFFTSCLFIILPGEKAKGCIFLLFALITLSSFFYFSKNIRETKGVSLEEMGTHLLSK